MTVKDTITKYKRIELIGSNKHGTKFKMLGLLSKELADEIYGDYEVLSIRDFDETKSTSIIISESVVK